jgi:hypothetical protein
VALCVLVLNDHWLKHAALLPGWLTGKLSDFAGLIVAPLALGALIGARRGAARLGSFALVVVPFVAIKTSPAVAREVEQLTRVVGLDWRLWADWTDLVALVILPLAWRLQETSTRRTSRGRASWLLERLGAIGAAASCLATSVPLNEIETALAIWNVTHGTIELQIFRPRDPLACSAILGDPRGLLCEEDFALDACHRLDPFVLLPLDIDAVEREDGHPLGETEDVAARPCDAVLLRAPGLADTIVFWHDLSQETFDDPPIVHARFGQIENVGERLFLKGPAVAEQWPADFTPRTTSCDEAR